MTEPYYSDDLVTLYHGDCREITEWLTADVLVTDPPYGIAYRSGSERVDGNARSIANDHDTNCRDAALAAWTGPGLVFGTWKTPAPDGTNTVLVWDQDGALGMGDLSIPWKPSWQMIYVLGREWVGRRDEGSVLRCPPVQSVGRHHPHQKPVSLLNRLIAKCPPGVIADPFAGAGSTLIAARESGRRSIGVEVDEAHCESVARRLSQSVLDFGAVS